MARLVVRIQGACRIKDDSSRVSGISVRYAALNPIPRPEERHPCVGRIANPFSKQIIVTERAKRSHGMMYEKYVGSEKYLRVRLESGSGRGFP